MVKSPIKAIALSRVRYGYKRIHVQLKREGINVNKKRIHRLYCIEGLQLSRKRPRRNVSSAHRHIEQQPAKKVNESWAMDFVADQLHSGQKIRILTVIDTFSRECLATTVSARLRSEDVVKTLNQILLKRGAPQKYSVITAASFRGELRIYGPTATR